jgi:hypothetical protein
MRKYYVTVRSHQGLPTGVVVHSDNNSSIRTILMGRYGWVKKKMEKKIDDGHSFGIDGSEALFSIPDDCLKEINYHGYIGMVVSYCGYDYMVYAFSGRETEHRPYFGVKVDVSDLDEDDCSTGYTPFQNGSSFLRGEWLMASTVTNAFKEPKPHDKVGFAATGVLRVEKKNIKIFD